MYPRVTDVYRSRPHLRVHAVGPKRADGTWYDYTGLAIYRRNIYKQGVGPYLTVPGSVNGMLANRSTAQTLPEAEWRALQVYDQRLPAK